MRVGASLYPFCTLAVAGDYPASDPSREGCPESGECSDCCRGSEYDVEPKQLLAETVRRFRCIADRGLERFDGSLGIFHNAKLKGRVGLKVQLRSGVDSGTQKVQEFLAILSFYVARERHGLA